MRRRGRLTIARGLAMATGLFMPVLGASTACACAVCYGNPDSAMTQGLAAGIWVLLGCIGFLLAGFGGVFLYWIYRSRNLDLYLEEGASN